jgi:hypothetical protein
MVRHPSKKGVYFITVPKRTYWLFSYSSIVPDGPAVSYALIASWLSRPTRDFGCRRWSEVMASWLSKHRETQGLLRSGDLTDCSDESRWVIANGLTPSTTGEAGNVDHAIACRFVPKWTAGEAVDRRDVGIGMTSSSASASNPARCSRARRQLAEVLLESSPSSLTAAGRTSPRCEEESRYLGTPQRNHSTA